MTNSFSFAAKCYCYNPSGIGCRILIGAPTNYSCICMRNGASCSGSVRKCNETTNCPQVEKCSTYKCCKQGGGDCDGYVCNTKGCKIAATNLIEAIDSNIDPCVDFFAFACGKWIRKHPIPADRTSSGTLAVMDELVLKQMKGNPPTLYSFFEFINSTSVLLELSQGTIRSLAQSRILYASCMNTVRIDASRSRPLLTELNELYKNKDHQTTELLSACRRQGINILVSTSVAVDSNDTNRYLLHVRFGQSGETFSWSIGSCNVVSVSSGWFRLAEAHF